MWVTVAIEISRIKFLCMTSYNPQVQLKLHPLKISMSAVLLPVGMHTGSL